MLDRVLALSGLQDESGIRKIGKDPAMPYFCRIFLSNCSKNTANDSAAPHSCRFFEVVTSNASHFRKKSGRPLDTALEMLTRYFCVPGRVERQQLFPVVYSAYEEN